MKISKVVIAFMIVMSITTICFGEEVIPYEINPEEFTPTYKTDITEARVLGNVILGYIRNIAAISSVVLIAFLGIKFMIGSVEQRAEYKKSFLPLIIGMFIVLTSSTLLNLVWNTIQTGVCKHDVEECLGGTCSKCGLQIDAIGHLLYGESQNCVQTFCIRCGYSRCTSEQHYGDCELDEKCEICGATKHLWNIFDEANYTWECGVCGKSQYDISWYIEDVPSEYQ